MSKIPNFGEVPVIGGFKRQGDFPLTEANAIAVDAEGHRLDEFIDQVVERFEDIDIPTYGGLKDKPSINGVTLTGDIKSENLGIKYSDLAGVPTFTTNEGNVVTAIEGKSAYQIAKEIGKIDSTVTEEQWLNSLKGKSAYQVGIEAGVIPTGMSEQAWISSLKGDSGIFVGGPENQVHLLQAPTDGDIADMILGLDFGKYNEGDLVFVALDMGDFFEDLLNLFGGLSGTNSTNK